jgi:hypothetical protein
MGVTSLAPRRIGVGHMRAARGCSARRRPGGGDTGKRWLGISLLTVALMVGAAAGGGVANGSTATAPANDNFASPVVLSGDDAVRLGDTNVGATLETGEPTTIGGTDVDASVWYRWTAPADGQVRIDTLGSTFDTVLGVYTGSAVGSLTEIASNDDWNDLTSRVTFAATNATIYQIRVAGFQGATGTIDLHLHRLLPPANDNFANAIVLSGTTASRTADTNDAATLEAGEPATVAGATASASVWYRWTAGANGQLRIDTLTSDFDTLLAVYTGSAVGSLSEVASNDNGKDGFTSLVALAVTNGTTYQIRVDSSLGSSGTINLHLRELVTGPPPANDAFATPVVLSGQNASRAGDTNVNATLEAGEPTTVASAPAGTSVWYQWTPAASGTVTIDTTTSNFDTLLAVYTGSAVGTLSTLSSSDDEVGLTSSVTLFVTAATVYKIRVDGYGGDAGTINLHLNEVLPPANDDFANAIALSGRSAVRTGDTNVGATLEPGEPTTVAGEPSGVSVWYRWTAPVSGSARIDTITSNFDTLLGIYTGGAVNALTVVASDDQSGGSDTSAVTFAITAGTIYQIRVDGFFADTGLVNLHLVTAPDPPTALSTIPNSGLVNLSWTPPSVDGGSPLTGYTVRAYAGATYLGLINLGLVTQVNIGGLANGTAYTFTVASRNIAGLGAESAASSPVTPRTVPDPPTSVTATAGAAAATVSWSPPAYNGGSAITGYVVRRFVSGALDGVTSVGAVTQATIGGLTPGITYTFRVTALNAAGGGSQSAESNPITPVALSFALSITKSGAGSGTVKSNVGTINCGGVCSASFASGTAVTLVAVAASGSKFAGWSGGCTGSGQCTVTVTADTTAGARFNKVARCVVPNVKGKTLAAAKRKITAAHCRTGTVTRARSKTVRKGRVIRQSPKAGKKLPSGSKVKLTVSRGKR